MSKAPIIGIILDSAIDSEKDKFSSRPWYALRHDYADAVAQAGGVPILIPHNIDFVQHYTDLIDGLLIPGSDDDIHPNFYGQEIEYSKIITGKERTYFEFDLLKSALNKNIPVLGICHGMQLINVFFGGSLIQHIPARLNSDVNHKSANNTVPSHAISISPGSLLSSIADGSDEFMVNSSHHQAVDRVGPCLNIVAKAPDGIIEAIELGGHKFVLGVEWHPEYLNENKLDNKILNAFIEACKNT